MDSPIIAHLHAHAATFEVEELRLALRNQGHPFTPGEIERELRKSPRAKEVSPGQWAACTEASRQKGLF